MLETRPVSENGLRSGVYTSRLVTFSPGASAN
jgi:hypothetical protein